MKFLIISYYAPPLNAIPAMRAFTLASMLSKKYEVHVITRKWNGDENSWAEMKASVGGKIEVKSLNEVFVHYLPYKEECKYRFLPKKIQSVYDWYTGDYNKQTNTYQFYKYIKRLMEKNNFKYIFATSTPLNIISLARKLSNLFNVPYIADFRDLHNHLVLKEKKSFSIKDKVELFFLKRYLKTNLKNSILVTTVNEPILNFINELITVPVKVVLNGFESDFFQKLDEVTSAKFEVTIIGTLYPQQNIDVLLDGFRQFIEKINDNTIEFNFIGTASIFSIKSYISEKLPYQQVNISPKINRLEALLKGKKASVLFYAGWPGYKGIYSGKIFEYLGLRRNILIAPGDKDVIDELIYKTKSGKIANNSDEVFLILLEWYLEWKEKGKLKYNGVGIENYSRERQYQKIIEYL